MAIAGVNLVDIKRQIKDYDYIRFTWSDIHGIARGKIVPVKQVPGQLEDGVSCYSGLIALGPRTELVPCKEVVAAKHCNVTAKPTSNHVTPIPWAGADKYHVGEIICEPHWLSGGILEASPRYVARKQLDKLSSMGFELMSACEQEFLFVKDGKPLFDGNNFCIHLRFSDVEELMFDVDQHMQKCGIEAEAISIEYSPGQVEMAFKPKYNMETADDMFLFKNGVKEYTKKKGITAVFISKPYPREDASCGTHFNHSLWSTDKKRNVFYDASKPDNISDLGLHWIGGICKHMDAITALCCPTVNCYRRLHRPWAPDKQDWDIDNRLVTWRVKNANERATYMENRIPSGASNIYLVMAATLAAGIDGIENKIKPPQKGTRDDTLSLPSTLQEALDALEADSSLCEALGTQFVEWFLLEKRTVELAKFGKHNMKQMIEEEIEAEQEEYCELI